MYIHTYIHKYSISATGAQEVNGTAALSVQPDIHKYMHMYIYIQILSVLQERTK